MLLWSFAPRTVEALSGKTASVASASVRCASQFRDHQQPRISRPLVAMKSNPVETGT